MVIALAATAALAAQPAQAQPEAGPPTVIDGPSSDIVNPTGLQMSIARDGTGGLVYLKQVSGVEHVFVSVLNGGSFGAPAQLDAPLPASSSQPVIAAGNGGLLVVAFINSGSLYEVTRASAIAGWGQPTALVGGAGNPALQMTNLGKAYLAFTLADGGGHDIRAAYYYNGAWSIEGPPLNLVAGDDAGTGSGRPAVAASGDGVGIVDWGEAGHVYTRRVWAATPSAALQQVDAPPPNCTQLAADEPAIGSGGDSSYAGVAYHATLDCGGQRESRVISNRLHASVYDGIFAADGLTVPAGDGAEHPGVTAGEYGHGWITSSRIGSHDVYGAFMGDNAATPNGVIPINGEANASEPYPVPATAGLYSNLIAWQHDPGAGGAPDIRVRYASNGGSSLGPEMALSSASNGPTNAGGGITAAGDVNGDAAVAWLQGSPGAEQIVVAQLYQTPAPIAAVTSFRYSRTSRVLLAWAPQRASWGPINYKLTVDGVQVGQTSGTAFAVDLPDGSHRWQVTATNPAGLTSTMSSARVFVDTSPPVASFTLTGKRTLGSTLRLIAKYTDVRAGLPGYRTSGVVKATVYWGDRTPHETISHQRIHVYKRAGRYKVRLVVQDRAGNTTTVFRFVKITKGAPKQKTAPGAPKKA